MAVWNVDMAFGISFDGSKPAHPQVGNAMHTAAMNLFIAQAPYAHPVRLDK
jgi:hypothetical protein